MRGSKGFSLIETMFVVMITAALAGVATYQYRVANESRIASKIISQTLNTANLIQQARGTHLDYQWLSTTTSYTWQAYNAGLYDSSIERFSTPVLKHAGGGRFRLNDVPQANMIPAGFVRSDAYRIMLYGIERPQPCLKIVSELQANFDSVSISYVPIKDPNTGIYDLAKAKQYCNNYTTLTTLQFVTF